MLWTLDGERRALQEGCCLTEHCPLALSGCQCWLPLPQSGFSSTQGQTEVQRIWINWRCCFQVDLFKFCFLQVCLNKESEFRELKGPSFDFSFVHMKQQSQIQEQVSYYACFQNDAKLELVLNLAAASIFIFYFSKWYIFKKGQFEVIPKQHFFFRLSGRKNPKQIKIFGVDWRWISVLGLKQTKPSFAQPQIRPVLC